MREKLIEILMSKPYGHSTYEEMADYLIANGVTLDNQVASSSKQVASSKWIPVAERLPEDDLPKGSKVKQIKVLTALKSGKGVRTVRSQTRYRMTWYPDSPWAWKYSASEITHWMPLPDAPKGE